MDVKQVILLEREEDWRGCGGINHANLHECDQPSMNEKY